MKILTFPHVLLLLQYEHVVVEELLQLLVAEVDAHLLETVVVEDLEAGDVQHADEGDPGSVKKIIYFYEVLHNL